MLIAAAMPVCVTVLLILLLQRVPDSCMVRKPFSISLHSASGKVVWQGLHLNSQVLIVVYDAW